MPYFLLITLYLLVYITSIEDKIRFINKKDILLLDIDSIYMI